MQQGILHIGHEALIQVLRALTLPTPDVVAYMYHVQTRQSPYMDVFHAHRVVRVTIDSGATGNMIRHSTAKHLGCSVISSAQTVQQADGSSQLQVVGEIRTTFTRDNTDFTFEGLVVEDLDVEVLAGTPFMQANDVAVRPAKREVLLGNGSVYTYGLLFSMLLLLPRLFGPENSWKYSFQTMLLLIPSMHLILVLMHQVHINSSHPSCGRSLVSFQVLRGLYAYQTCQQSLAHLSVTNSSARSPLSLNPKRIHLQARLLLSVCYHPLTPVTLHPFR